MKLLKSGRRVLIWVGVQFADSESVSWQRMVAHHLFALAFAIIFIAISTLYVITFLKLHLVNPEEFFFILLQFVVTIHAFTSFITIYACASHISTVFRLLTEIYEKCKPVWLFLFERKIKNFTVRSFPQRSWWTIDSFKCRIRMDLWTFARSYKEIYFYHHNITIDDNNFILSFFTWTIRCWISVSSV